MGDRRWSVQVSPRPRHHAARALCGLALAIAALVLTSAASAAPSAPAPKKPTAKRAPAKSAARVEYWIGAVPTSWNVVPSGTDPMTGTTYDPDKTTLQAPIYRRFSADWKNQLPAAGYGLVGPIIQAEVGDTIVVHFKNFDPASPHSIHFHGVHRDAASDGAYIPGISGPGADVKPGQTFTYRLTAGADSVGVWPYYDHSPSMEASLRGGLYGALSIRPRGQKKPDREFVVFLGRQLGLDTVDGLAFINNTPTFRAKVGETVQWDVLALGDDTHSFHVHGHRWITPAGPRDVGSLSPGESFSVRWKEDKPGTWLYHCHVVSHRTNGMVGLYVVAR